MFSTTAILLFFVLIVGVICIIFALLDLIIPQMIRRMKYSDNFCINQKEFSKLFVESSDKESDDAYKMAFDAAYEKAKAAVCAFKSNKNQAQAKNVSEKLNGLFKIFTKTRYYSDVELRNKIDSLLEQLRDTEQLRDK